MKHIHKLSLIAAVGLLSACVDLDYSSDLIVEKPQDVATQEYLNSFDLLKSYINREANSPFRLGVTLAPAEFQDRGLAYSTLVTNFEGIDINGVYIPADMQATDGSYDFSGVRSVGNGAQDAGVSIYGAALYSNQGQPAAYLNKLLEPQIIPFIPEKGSTAICDFENDDLGTAYTMTNGSSAVVEEDPDGKSGKVLHVGTKSSKASDSYPVMKVKLPAGRKLGDYNTLTFDMRIVNNDGIWGQGMRVLINGTKFPVGDSPAGMGCSSNVWSRSLAIKLNSAEVPGFVIPDNLKDLTEFNLALGSQSGSAQYYLDNITMHFETGSVGEYIFADFESDNVGALYPSVQKFGDDRITIEVVSDPAGESGKALQIGPKKNVSEYHLPMFDVKLPTGKTLGDMNTLTFDAWWDNSGNNADVRVYILPPGWTNRDKFRYQFSSFGDIVGSMKDKWVRNVSINIQGGTITLADEVKGLTEFQIAIGLCTHTPMLYMDNIGFRWESKGEDEIIEKTDEEKKAILTAQLGNWISGMVQAGGENITMWDVVSEPLNETADANTFNWGQYLGDKECVRMAVKMAREASETELKLFVGNSFNQYNDITSSIDRLTDLVSQWQEDGVTVIDGYNIRLQAIFAENADNLEASKKQITKILEQLAATGKGVRLSGLSMIYEDATGNFVSTAKIVSVQRERAAEYMAFIIKEYFRVIAPENQYGISFSSMTETADGSNICPWTSGYGRTEMYEGIVNGLK